MNQRFRLRAIILNYNRSDLTLRSVKSVLSQTYYPLDVIVVDNGSTPSDLAKLEQDLPDSVTFIKNSQNLGYSAGNNVGICANNLPAADYVMVLNNDVELIDPDTCTELVNTLINHPTRVAVSPLVNTERNPLPLDSTIQIRRVPDFRTVLVANSWWLKRIWGLRQIYNHHIYADYIPYPPNQILACETINGSCFIIDALFLEQIGYLDEGTFLYYEEIILGWQIKHHGKIAGLLTSAVVEHEQGATSGHHEKQFKLKMRLEMVRSERYYCQQYLHISYWKHLLLRIVRTIDLLSLFLFHHLLRLFK